MTSGPHEFISAHVIPLVRALGIETRQGWARLPFDHDIEFIINTTDHHSLVVWYREAADKCGPVFSITSDLRGDPLAAEIHKVVRVARGLGVPRLLDPLSGRLLCELPGAQPADAMINLWYVFRGAILPLLYQGQWRFWSDPKDARVWQLQQFARIRQLYGFNYEFS